jgi:Amt family ammonium transporter
MEPMLLVLLGVGALLVRLGQAVGAMGMSRAKNVASAGFRSLADLCIATLCFWAIGSAILFHGTNPVFGITWSYIGQWRGHSPQFFLYLVFILISTGMIAPAVAERSRLRVPLAISALLAGLVVPIVGHWTWFGWLYRIGFIDQAGAAAIHLAPAVCAAIAALLVGPREAKYNRDGSSNMIPGHSVMMILVSVLLMLAGWVPYTLARLSGLAQVTQDLSIAAGNVFVAAAAGGATATVVGVIRFGKADVMLACSGILGGLVAISAGGGVINSPSAFLIGVLAGLVVPWLTVLIDLRFRIDDPGGVVAVHGGGAMLGLLATGLLAPGSIAVRFQQLGIQALGMVSAILLPALLATALMIVLRARGVRSREADEYDGLDLAEHDVNANPDFQQTMIKSYHLREA